MHYLARLIVEANTAKEAMELVNQDLDDLVERNEFDWYDLNGRWGKSKAFGINSKTGKKLIAEGMEESRREFGVAMDHIRYMVDNYTDDQIYNEEFDKNKETPKGIYHLSRYMFSAADSNGGNSVIYLMNGNIWGGRIRNGRDLSRALNYKTRSKLWVIPVDCHN